MNKQQEPTPEEELQQIPEDTRSKEDILQGCRRAIWARLDRITKALIAQTLKKGSYLHARFLFDLVGVSHEEKEPREDGSLVELLLEKLGSPNPPPDDCAGDATDTTSGCHPEHSDRAVQQIK
jgi:hypothetical protein